MPPRRLLIVAHAPSPNTRQLLDAVVAGARSPEINDVEVRVVAPLQAGADDVLAAEALILGTTENLGYMSGALKDFSTGSTTRACRRRRGCHTPSISAPAMTAPGRDAAWRRSLPASVGGRCGSR